MAEMSVGELVDEITDGIEDRLGGDLLPRTRERLETILELETERIEKEKSSQ